MRSYPVNSPQAAARIELKWADACPVEERTLADLMGEVQRPALQMSRSPSRN